VQYDIRFYWHYGCHKSEEKKGEYGSLFRTIVCQVNRNGLQSFLDSSKGELHRGTRWSCPLNKPLLEAFRATPRCIRARRSPPVAPPSAASQCQPHSDATSSFQSLEAGQADTLGGDCTAVLLVDTHFVVVSLPTIATGPEEREFDRSTLIAVDGNIGELNSESSGS